MARRFQERNTMSSKTFLNPMFQNCEFMDATSGCKIALLSFTSNQQNPFE